MADGTLLSQVKDILEIKAEEVTLLALKALIEENKSRVDVLSAKPVNPKTGYMWITKEVKTANYNVTMSDVMDMLEQLANHETVVKVRELIEEENTNFN